MKTGLITGRFTVICFYIYIYIYIYKERENKLERYTTIINLKFEMLFFLL